MRPSAVKNRFQELIEALGDLLAKPRPSEGIGRMFGSYRDDGRDYSATTRKGAGLVRFLDGPPPTRGLAAVGETP